MIKVEGISKKYDLNKFRKEAGDTLYSSAINTIRDLGNLMSKKQTEEFWALKDVSFEIEKGDRVGIIGRNGAGKSTLLKILSRITPPTAGRIEYSGRMASLLEVGTGFHGDLSGRENIYLNGSILGMKKWEIDEKFDEIVAFSEIEKFIDTPVKRYSSGMYVRLAFAVAAHLEPDILIIDEVLAVGDAAFQKKCLGKMEDVSQNQGRTILFVSHSLSTVSKLCNKGLLLKNGVLQCQGQFYDVMKAYESMYSDLPNFERSDFAFRSDEKLGDSFQIQSVRLLDVNGNNISGVNTYSAFKIETTFYSPRDVVNGSINIVVKTTNEVNVLRFATSPDQNVDYPFIKGMNKIVLTIPKLPLPQGQFVVSIGLAIPMREWLLGMKDYFLLNVEENDVFNSGYHPIIDNSVALTDYKWEIF